MNQNSGEKKAQGIDPLVKHSKKIIFSTAIVAVLTAGAMVFAWWYTSGNKVVATFDGKQVMKTEYDDAKLKCDGFYQYNKDEDGKKNCSQTEIEDQILRKALETEAEKRNITVTKEEIDKKYNELVAAYGNEETYKVTIKSAYGWTTEYVKANLKRDLLKEKLSPYLINYREVYGVFVRYDWSDDGVSTEQIKADEIASKEMLEKNLSPLVKSDTYKSKTEEEIIKIQTQKRSPWDVMARIGTMDQKRLNTETAKDRFKGSEDWAAILKLQKVGDTTDIVRSSGGYFVIYRLESISEGKFSNWEEFTKDVVGKAKINSVSYKYNSAKRATSQKVHNFLTRVEQVFGVNLALAGSTCDYGDLYGWIADGSNTALRINGVSLDASEDSGGTHGKCSGAKKNLHADSVSWVYGGGGFKIGNAGDSTFKALDCHVGWKISVTKSGYQSLEWRQRLVKPNGGERVLDAPLRWDAGWGGESYSGPEGSCNGGCVGLENTNGDGLIIMQPNIPSPNGNFDNITCVGSSSDRAWGWACDPLDFSYISNIDVYVDGPHVAHLGPANVYRPDLQHPNNLWACGGIGTHGFSKSIDDIADLSGVNLRDGGAHSIIAYAFRSSAGNPNYTLGTKTVTCPIGATVEMDASPGNVTLTSSCALHTTPDSVEQGTPTSLTWSINNQVNTTPSQIKYRTTNAASCTAWASPARTAWSGTKPASNGVWSTPIPDYSTQTTTYYIQCKDAAGKVGRRVQKTVTVNPAPNGSASISKASPLPSTVILPSFAYNGATPIVSGSPISIMPVSNPTTYTMNISTGLPCTKQVNVRPRNSTNVTPVAP